MKLQPGSLVAVVAPAGRFDRDELFRGLAWVSTRYRLRLDCRVLGSDGYFAGSDEARADVLARAMLDDRVDAILCARGGYGSIRILDALPWDEFACRPKPIIGFSDVTALHLAANARGVPSVHGPNATGLGATRISAAERASLLAVLEDQPLAPWTGLEVLSSASAPLEVSGVVVGGNLALVDAMATARRLIVPKGAIVVLEDVTERPYRIDRMLTSLLLGGHLANAGAIVFGDFARCDPGPDGVTVADVLRDRARKLAIPVLARAPFGHGAPNHAFPLGRTASVRGDRVEWSGAHAASA